MNILVLLKKDDFDRGEYHRAIDHENNNVFYMGSSSALPLNCLNRWDHLSFTGRVSASTQCTLQQAVIAALACFDGSLHGGAVEEVMIMLKQVEEEYDVESYLTNRCV